MLLFALLVCAAPVSPTLAQDRPSAVDTQMLDELRQIRQLLERMLTMAAPGQEPQAGDRTVRLSSTAGPALGRPGAAVTIVEDTDLQCPFCRQFTLTTFPEIKKRYIDTGLVRFVTRDFPLPTLHPLATTAAHASRCAGEQGNLWEMRHAILERNDRLNERTFDDIAKELTLDGPRFTACLAATSKYEGAIRADLASGTAAGVTGTPSFVVGRTSNGGFEGTLLVGARPFEQF